LVLVLVVMRLGGMIRTHNITPNNVPQEGIQAGVALLYDNSFVAFPTGHEPPSSVAKTN
jgi:hypothetical protein